MPAKGKELLERAVVNEPSNGTGQDSTPDRGRSRVSVRPRRARGVGDDGRWGAARTRGLVRLDMAYARGVETNSRGARAGVAVRGLSLFALMSLACAGEPGELMNSTSSGNVEVPPWACVPGETQPCPCDDGPPGLVTCEPDGTGFGACDCSPGAVSQEPPLTSTGSDTATDTEGTATAGTATGETTVDPTSGSTSAPDPTTSEGSSSGAPDPTTSGGSTGASSSG
jgi:hypothetical protein